MIYVVLFRGINVGGKNPLPMKELVPLLESLGYRGVTTYIQSGNVVLATDEADHAAPGGHGAVAQQIASAVEGRFGFKPALVLVTLDEIEQVVAENPFPGGEADPKALHVAFLGATSQHRQAGQTGRLCRLHREVAPGRADPVLVGARGLRPVEVSRRGRTYARSAGDLSQLADGDHHARPGAATRAVTPASPFTIALLVPIVVDRVSPAEMSTTAWNRISRREGL